MTAAQRAAKDKIEDAKGAPVSLTPYVFFFFLFFSVITVLFFRLLLFCYIDLHLRIHLCLSERLDGWILNRQLIR
jgi:hypothetical protein